MPLFIPLSLQQNALIEELKDIKSDLLMYQTVRNIQEIPVQVKFSHYVRRWLKTGDSTLKIQ